MWDRKVKGKVGDCGNVATLVCRLLILEFTCSPGTFVKRVKGNSFAVAAMLWRSDLGECFAILCDIYHANDGLIASIKPDLQLLQLMDSNLYKDIALV